MYSTIEIKNDCFEDFPGPIKNASHVLPNKFNKLFIRSNNSFNDFAQKTKNNKWKFLSIVGSRKHTDYGKDVCVKLIKSLKDLPVVIVSGLALGIDSVAHREALKNNLPTIAIPGSGLDDNFIYPHSHYGLAKDILNSGNLLISPFPLKTPANQWTFPIRNRLIAAMSSAVLIIESDHGSGTLITAKSALEFNRDVLAVPGSIFNNQSNGTNHLIKSGAIPITNENDLKEVLGFEIEEKNTQNKNQSKPNLNNRNDLSQTEKKILEFIITEPIEREVFIEKIINELNMDISEINTFISLLELKNIIKENYGKIWFIE